MLKISEIFRALNKVYLILYSSIYDAVLDNGYTTYRSNTFGSHGSNDVVLVTGI